MPSCEMDETAPGEFGAPGETATCSPAFPRIVVNPARPSAPTMSLSMDRAAGSKPKTSIACTVGVLPAGFVTFTRIQRDFRVHWELRPALPPCVTPKLIRCARSVRLLTLRYRACSFFHEVIASFDSLL